MPNASVEPDFFKRFWQNGPVEKAILDLIRRGMPHFTHVENDLTDAEWTAFKTLTEKRTVEGKLCCDFVNPDGEHLINTWRVTGHYTADGVFPDEPAHIIDQRKPLKLWLREVRLTGFGEHLQLCLAGENEHDATTPDGSLMRQKIRGIVLSLLWEHKSHDGLVTLDKSVKLNDSTLHEEPNGGVSVSVNGSVYPTSCHEEAKVRGGATTAVDVAQERGDDYIRNHPFPGLKDLARRCYCHHSVMKKAITGSKIMAQARAAFDLQRAKPGVSTRRRDNPAWQAEVAESLRILIENAPEGERSKLNTPEMHDQLVKMTSEELAALVDYAKSDGK